MVVGASPTEIAMTKTEHIIEMMIEKTRELLICRRHLVTHATSAKNKEHRTIRLQLPRQSGQTQSVLTSVKSYFSKPLFICGTQNNIKILKEFKHNCSLVTRRSAIEGEALVGRDFDCVIIDNASLIKQEDIDKIYNNLEPVSALHDNFLFILIG